MVQATRIAWILDWGSIPDDLSMCHLCDNTLCVNTDHLRPGTHKFNMGCMKHYQACKKSVERCGGKLGSVAGRITREDLVEIIAWLKKLKKVS